MGRGHQQILDIVIIDGLHTFDAPSASVLGLEIVDGHSLDIAKRSHGDHRILVGDQILIVDIMLIGADLAAAVVAVLFCDGIHLILDDAQQQLFVCQNSL